MQPPFALSAAALVFEQMNRSLAVGPAEQDVRDELLEAGIFFHLAAGAVLDMIAIHQSRPIAINLARESLKIPKLAEQAGRNNENLFLGNDGHGKSFCQMKVREAIG